MPTTDMKTTPATDGPAASPSVPRRVMIIAPQPFFEWRGSPIRVSFLVRALAELGFAVDLLCMPVGAPFSCAGVSVHRPPNLFRVRSIPIGPSLRKAVYDVLLLVCAMRLALTRRYGVIHGIEEAGLLAVLVGRLFSARVIYEKHSDPGSHRGGRLRNLVLRAYAAVERLTIRSADATIATGPGLARQVRSVLPRADVRHIFDIPSSMKRAGSEGVAAARRALERAPGEVLITYVGSFAAYQGIDLMFASMPAVLRGHARARFVVIGGDPPQVAERREGLAGQGLAGRVSFVGRVPPDELPDYLAASDILLSPRIAGQNTPLKLLDYLAAGRPILATDTAANRLLLNESMALFTAPRPDEFAAGILRLAGDAALRARLGAMGQQMVRNCYNFEGFKQRLHVCYRDLLEGDSHRPAAAGSAAMIRDTDGSIVVWDVGAEALYGFGARDAVGSVSHRLLRTEFPERLSDIERELGEREQWEGVLVHTTQTGRKVHVLSSWRRILTDDGAVRVFEVNEPIVRDADRHARRMGGFSAAIFAAWPELADLLYLA